ncbi:isoflavone reductase-like protein [Chenopodium quinoa]|uniref:NmrA-like domain-containing protein n=1 Tax=Chenopodium quinoa TaxID=63459 RepID=A0A803MMX3_CHEQI|nr:isoflavone reductase-like protein [Chenopodium quinoa]
MASKSKVLIIGATGYIGKFIAEASVKNGHQTFALVREETFSKVDTQEYFHSLGVNVLIGDIYDHKSLLRAMEKVDVVISTVGHRYDHSNILIHDQRKIIAAIKKSNNIKRFLPSEFGMDVDRVHAVDAAKSLFEAKSKLRRVIEEEKIPYTIVCANYFARTCIQNLFQHPDLEAPPRDLVHILGDGTPRGIFNMEEDIAMYTIKAMDDPRTLNKILYIRPSANIYSFNELVSLWENKIGNNLERIYVTEEQLLKNIRDETDALMKMILSVAYSVFVKGDQCNFEIKPSFGLEATTLYPELKYTTVDEFLNQFV